MVSDVSGGICIPLDNLNKMVVPNNMHSNGAPPTDRETLRTIIVQWNANRLDLFELSEPDENMEFFGVMRFYFQDDTQKIATKCVRVTSSQMAKDTVEVLIEKFRPDMRMLTLPRFGLYEVHANGEERKLRDEEKPLLVQLNWHKDDREGRFLLKNEDAIPSKNGTESRKFERRLSKREKKELKKKEKEEKLKDANESVGTRTNGKETDAERLFKQLPETSFHRSISNPEAVMRRRRQQKLEKKLQQFKSKDGGPDTGGTLKIFGESINPDVPYKTLLLSINDSAETVIKQTLEKYGLERDDFSKYCLVQAVFPPGSTEESIDSGFSVKETVLAPTECPLRILMHFPAEQGILVFNLKKRTDVGKPLYRPEVNGISRPVLVQNPYLVEVVPNGLGQAVQLFPGVTEVGNDHSRMGAPGFFHLTSPDVQPSHCLFQRLDTGVVVTPCSSHAFVTVDGRRVENAQMLQNGSAVRLGQAHVFRFFMPQMFNGAANGTFPSREKLQLPLTAIAQPKRSPDGDIRGQPPMQTDSVETDAVESSSSIPSHRSSPDVNLYGRHNGGVSSKLPILPATIEFREEREDAFLVGVMHPNPAQITFKLSPTYVLYMAARYRASTNFRPEIVPVERARLLSEFLMKIASILLRVIKEREVDSESLAFYLTNASELLHLLKLDRHMSPYGADAHDMLVECVHLAFHHLTCCQQEQLDSVLPGLFATDQNESNAGWGSVLNVLSSTMFLLRRCRLNAALTIQLFSHLFHFINMWLFNTLIRHPQQCNRRFGNWLKAGLDHVLQWAEKQGLELAADCHLSKIIQAATLLVMPKNDPNATSYASTCYRLNSLQVRFLLENYRPEPQEYPLTHDLLDNVTSVARSLVDEPTLLSGLSVQLEEDPELHAQFLIPEDGYSVDVVSGVPAGIQEFLEPLSRAKICELSVHPFSQGLWTVYLTPSSGDRSPSTSYDSTRLVHPTHHHHPHIVEVAFPKGTSGIGLSIVAARGATQDKMGIYIKSVVKGGAADADGRLQSGDQLLKVNGKGLVGVTQDRAAELIAQSGPTVQLDVLKQGAFAHGLATVLNGPSPPPPVTTKPPMASTPARSHGLSQPDFSSNGHPLRNGHAPRPSDHWAPDPPSPLRIAQPPVSSAVNHYPQQLLKSPLSAPAVPQILHHQLPNGHRSPDNPQFFSPAKARVPSPVREAIASQMAAQRDKIRQDAKIFEMEDELRRRREHIQQGPNGARSPVNGAVIARPLVNDQRSISTERIDRAKQPSEKRVQWAIDSPKKTPSPTSRGSPVVEAQVVRVPVPGSAKPPLASEIQSWSRGFKERSEQNVSPSSTPWQREENQQMKQWRVTEARRLRDEEIESLRSRDDLTENEAGKLQALLLERDFQKRAEEALHDGDGEEEEEPDEEEDENDEMVRQIHITSVLQPKLTVPKATPHLHHPVAAAAPDTYKTRQQEDYDAFLRRHEIHAVNEAIRRSRDHLNNMSSNLPPVLRYEQQTFSYPVTERRSASPKFRSEETIIVKRQTAGTEIKNEVEASRPSASAVVGIHEVYNDPRHKILNAKFRPADTTDISPEKLSFRDKMKKFATTMEESRERAMSSSK